MKTKKVSKELICAIGLNRKSRDFDAPYFELYRQLHSVFYKKEINNIEALLNAIDKIKLKKWWRAYLFDTSNNKAIISNPQQHIHNNIFQNLQSEKEFKTAFFKTMHLFKAKATLSDYYDLNCRYIKTTNIILFEDGIIRLDIVPKQFFNQVAKPLYEEAFSCCKLLQKDCLLQEISAVLVFNEQQIIEGLNSELNEDLEAIEQAYDIIEERRYERFKALIEKRFSNENILKLLDCFDSREDKIINSMVTDNADVPTIFEYIVGIIWYKVSNQKGKILDYMNLSLDADLLPITHASGGQADIVYEYEKTKHYPQHSLLLEATLADNTNQRRMEMEPVSRHLGNYLLKTNSTDSYCIFVTNNLHVNVISDFRGRKNLYYYNPQNTNQYIEGMKIIPLQTSDLRSIIKQDKKYAYLYERFERAFQSSEMQALKWYNDQVEIHI